MTEQDLKQLADLNDENIDLESIKEILAKKYGHLNWAQIKNKTRKGELDVSDLIAFCDEANRLFYKKEIERLKAEREWISVVSELPKAPKE